MSSGPGALRGLILLKDLHTSALDITGGHFGPPQSGSCSQSVHRRSSVPVLSLSTANSSPGCVPGLPVFVQITLVVSVCSCCKFGTDFTFNPGLLIWECPYSNPRYNAINAFTGVAYDCVRVCVYVVVLKTHTPECKSSNVGPSLIGGPVPNGRRSALYPSRKGVST